MKPSYRFGMLLAGLIGLAYPLASLADFAVKEDPSDPCYQFPRKENYGNGQTCRFRRAVSGGYVLSQQEVDSLNRYLPINESNRYYARINVDSSSSTLGSFKNKSTSVGDTTGIIVVKKVTKTSPAVELAFGYVWSPTFRGEVEYIANRNITYFANPVLEGTGVTTPRSLTTVVQTNPILFNAYYDFKWFERFRPFVMGGIGFSVNSIKTTLSPLTGLPNSTVATGQTNKQIGTFAYTLGAGFRVWMFSHWFINASLRYVNLGITPRKSVV